ncbi:MAG: hypothetical protein OCD01_17000 [Fibrobacterales bacterium]
MNYNTYKKWACRLLSIMVLAQLTSCAASEQTMSQSPDSFAEQYREQLTATVAEVAPTHSLLVNIDSEELERLYREYTLYALGTGMSQPREMRYKEFGLQHGRSGHTISLIDSYMTTKKVRVLEKTLESIFKDIPEITPDPFSPIRQTAYFGTYTFKGALSINGCSDEPEFDAQVKRSLDLLKGVVREHFDGYKITEIHYNCVTMDDSFDLHTTTGVLEVGYYWKKSTYETEKIASCQEEGTRYAPEFTTNWCQDSWNDLRPVESFGAGGRLAQKYE